MDFRHAEEHITATSQQHGGHDNWQDARLPQVLQHAAGMLGRGETWTYKDAYTGKKAPTYWGNHSSPQTTEA